MPRFKKKPVEIEAIQFTGDNIEEIWDAFTAEHIYGPGWMQSDPTSCYIETLEGTMECPVGHYVIKGVKGEIYSCDPEIFKMSYDQVDW